MPASLKQRGQRFHPEQGKRGHRGRRFPLLVLAFGEGLRPRDPHPQAQSVHRVQRLAGLCPVDQRRDQGQPDEASGGKEGNNWI